MTSFRVILALVLVMVAVLLAAGCEEKHLQQNHEVIVGKVNADGNPAWTILLNDGIDVSADDIIQLPNGDIAVAGSIRHNQCKDLVEMCQNHPRIVLLSNNGDILQKKESNESHYVLSMHFDEISLEKRTIVYSYSNVWNLSADGELSDKRILEKNYEPDSIVWMESNGSPSNQKILSVINGTSLLQMNSNYTIFNETFLGQAINPIIRAYKDGYLIQFSGSITINGSPDFPVMNEIYLDKEGYISHQRELQIPPNYFMAQTGDYFFIGFLIPYSEPERYTSSLSNSVNSQSDSRLHIVKMNYEGAILWDTPVSNITARSSIPVKIIQTTDGGAAFLIIRDL